METRRALRINTNLKITSKINGEFQEKFRLVSGKSFEVNMLDISELGVGLLSKYFLPGGLILELEIDGTPFGLQEIMKIKGEIRYCKYVKSLGYRCGVKFLKPSEIYRKAIAQFISIYERRKAPRVQLAE